MPGGNAVVSRNWRDVLGAWLGVGTAPGTLVVGAGLASRYDGPIPILSILLGLAAMYAVVWFPGLIGIAPPIGEGLKFTELSPLYFKAGMQKTLATLIAIGMIGWFGFNVGLGGAALSALIKSPGYFGPLLIGIPVLLLSLMGIKSWNGLAAVTTISVIILVVLVSVRYSVRMIPLTLSVSDPSLMVVDIAAFVGYVSLFSVRAPDFSSGFTSKKDLVISDLLLCVPVVLFALAGVGLQKVTGSVDLVGILAQPGGLAIGNLLVFLAVIAPTFTIFYSGAPALQAATGINKPLSMIIITVVGLILAIARFDLLLINWLKVLVALLPPLVIPLAVEANRRRQGKTPHLVSIWLWLPGALVSVILTWLKQPLAALIGLFVSMIVTSIWLLIIHRKQQ